MVEELPFPTAILLDWDGTICDSLTRVHDVLSGIGKEMGLPAITHKQSHDATIHGSQAGNKLFHLDQEENKKYWDLFSERFFIFDGQVTLLEGAAEFIQSVPPVIPIGIVSNNRSDLLNAQIQHLGWAERFGAVVAVDDAPKNKPAPDAALYALDKLDVPASRNVWFVGDTRGDIECAHAAGLTSILLSQSEPTDCTPHYRFTDCTPLRKHFSL